MDLGDVLDSLDELSRRARALPRIVEIVQECGSIDGDHHKAWVLDQVMRLALGESYEGWRKERLADGDAWDEGVVP